MPKIKKTRNRVIIHVGDLWKKYARNKNWIFRIHDIGRKGHTERIAVKIRDKWYTYAYSFSKDQISVLNRNIRIKDRKTFEIIKRLKDNGDLKGYKLSMMS